MSDILRKPLMVLVLLNIAFVHLTGAVAPVWLGTLYVLTLAAPLMARYQSRALYRAGWNLGILGVFGTLALHAQTRGIVHLLEDGLLLASLCQVHLLNNLGTRQRPDLLFFNSFLIAFVTSFFSPDLGFFAVFVGYVATLIPALQLFCATRHQTEVALPDDAWWSIVRNGAPRTVAVLAATVVVFMVWPRDFEREGWMGEDDSHLSHAVRMAMGLADRVDPERGPAGGDEEQILLTIEPIAGDPSLVPTHWRGSTFSSYGRGGWQDRSGPFDQRPTDLPWQKVGRGMARAGSEDATVRVTIRGGSTAWLLTPREACAVRLDDAFSPRFLNARSDGNLRYDAWFDPNSARNRTFEVGLTRSPARAPDPSSIQRRQLLALLPERLPDGFDALVRSIAATVPDTAPTSTVAHAAERYLRSNWDYALPGTPSAARSFEQFLEGAPGHCEYFASALTLLLRARSIPARLVSGVSVQEWDEEAGMFVVRAKHAHAWVEAWDDELGWMTLDATPAASASADEEEPTGWARIAAPFRSLWRAVTGFDAETRATWVAWITGLPGRAWAVASAHPFATGALLLALVELLRRWRRRRRRDPAVDGLETALRRCGLRPQPGETPRELLARARAASVDGAAVDRLAAAVEAHESARYAAAF